MIKLLYILPFLGFAQVGIVSVKETNRNIDIVTVYERVLEMGYENKQIYDVLIFEYRKRNDTLKVKYYKKLKL